MIARIFITLPTNIQNPINTISDLPPEILVRILQNLKANDVRAVSEVHEHLHDVILGHLTIENLKLPPITPNEANLQKLILTVVG